MTEIPRKRHFCLLHTFPKDSENKNTTSMAILHSSTSPAKYGKFRTQQVAAAVVFAMLAEWRSEDKDMIKSVKNSNFTSQKWNLESLFWSLMRVESSWEFLHGEKMGEKWGRLRSSGTSGSLWASTVEFNVNFFLRKFSHDSPLQQPSNWIGRD